MKPKESDRARRGHIGKCGGGLLGRGKLRSAELLGVQGLRSLLSFGRILPASVTYQPPTLPTGRSHEQDFLFLVAGLKQDRGMRSI